MLFACVLALAAAGRAQGQDGPAIEPEATAALQRMGQTLKGLRTFSVKGVASREDVLPQGVKVRRDMVSSLDVARPDHVRAEQTAAGWHRQIVYDGKTVSISSKSAGYYAQTPATATVYQLADRVESEYALDLPLLGLFAWADDAAPRPQLQLARVVGLANVHGVPCDQYVYRQDGMDWQLWIQRGAQALPRRLVVTSTRSDARLQVVEDYDWTLNPPLTANAFVFSPSPGEIAVPLARLKEVAVVKPR
jgi:hypothetical protein